MSGFLEGKVALITGAGSSIGMGKEMSLALIEEGAKVAMMDINRESLALSVNEALEIGGESSAIGIVGSIDTWSDASEAVSQTESQLGGIHILINNAGVRTHAKTPTGDSPFWNLTPEEWQRVISVNVNGTFMMTRAAIEPMLRQKWGRIIGVTTSLDTMIRGGNLPYGPSKAAIEAFVASIAQDLVGTGITANVLIPGGATNTNFIPEDTSYIRDQLIQPNVMRDPIKWLASDEANDFSGNRIIASNWNNALSLEERLSVAAAPAAWPQLGRKLNKGDR